MMQNDQTSGANKREITKTRGELTGKTARLGHVEQKWIQGATNMRNRQFWDGSKPIIIIFAGIKHPLTNLLSGFLGYQPLPGFRWSGHQLCDFRGLPEPSPANQAMDHGSW